MVKSFTFNRPPIKRESFFTTWLRSTVRVTHLAKKALQMRHKTSPHHRNPLKKRSLKPHE
jgi:hypothetical protein